MSGAVTDALPQPFGHPLFSDELNAAYYQLEVILSAITNETPKAVLDALDVLLMEPGELVWNDYHNLVAVGANKVSPALKPSHKFLSGLAAIRAGIADGNVVPIKDVPNPRLTRCHRRSSFCDDDDRVLIESQGEGQP